MNQHTSSKISVTPRQDGKASSYLQMIFADLVFSLLGLGALIWSIKSMLSTGLTQPQELTAANGLQYTGNWFPLVDTVHNAFTMWRYDYFATSLTQALLHNALLPESLSVAAVSIQAPAGLALSQYATSFLGSIVLFRVLNASWLRSIGMAAAITASLLACFHTSLVASGLSLWLPWFLAALLYSRLHYTNPLFALACCAYGAYRLTAAANYLSLFLIPLCLLLASVFPTQLTEKARRRYGRLLLLATLLPAFLMWWSAPLPPMPDFPSSSHVVADDGVAGSITPLVSAMSPIPFIDRPAVKAHLSAITLWLAFWCLLLSFLLFSRKEETSTYWKVPALFALVLVGDILLSEHWSQIFPLLTLERLLPLQFFYPLSVATIIALLFALPVVATQSARHSKSTLGVPSDWLHLLALGITCIVASPYGLFFRADALDAAMEFDARFENEHVDPALKNYYIEKVVSPSYPLLREEGLWIIDQSLLFNEPAFRVLRRYKPLVSASSSGNKRGVEGMLSSKKGSRWFAGNGPQKGEEWIHIKLPEPQRLKGIDLSAAAFHTDFPRGLRVSTALDCPDTPEATAKPAFSNYTLVADHPEWKGTIGLSKSGHFYRGPQAVVKVFFKETTLARCIAVEQTGTSSVFDWSISTLKILLEEDTPQ